MPAFSCASACLYSASSFWPCAFSCAYSGEPSAAACVSAKKTIRTTAVINIHAKMIAKTRTGMTSLRNDHDENKSDNIHAKMKRMVVGLSQDHDENQGGG